MMMIEEAEDSRSAQSLYGVWLVKIEPTDRQHSYPRVLQAFFCINYAICGQFHCLVSPAAVWAAAVWAAAV